MGCDCPLEALVDQTAEIRGDRVKPTSPMTASASNANGLSTSSGVPMIVTTRMRIVVMISGRNPRLAEWITTPNSDFVIPAVRET